MKNLRCPYRGGLALLPALLLAALCPSAFAGGFAIVEPNQGPYHAGEAPTQTEAGWLALTLEDGEWHLREATMEVKREYDPVFDEDGVPPTGLAVSCKEYPKALVLLKHPPLQAGKVAIPEEGAWQLSTPEEKDFQPKRLVSSFRLDGRMYWLEFFRNIHGASDEMAENDSYGMVDRLFLHREKPVKPTIAAPQPMQTIVWGDTAESMHAVMETHSFLERVWVGDLDRDGLPDLIVWSGGFNHTGVCLYLSSVSAPGVEGALPGRVDCRISTGD